MKTTVAGCVVAFLLVATPRLAAAQWVETSRERTVSDAGMIGFTELEDNPYLVNGRFRFHPLYAYLGTARNLGGYLAFDIEPTRRWGIFGSGAIPYKDLTQEGRASAYMQFEGGVRFHALDRMGGQLTHMTLTSSSSTTDYGTTRHTSSRELFVNTPTRTREIRGLRLGVQYLELPVRQKRGDWDATRIGGFLGYYSASHTNRRVSFAGYGERANRVQFSWFVDAMVAHILSTTAGPGEAAGAEFSAPAVGFGGRIGFDMATGIPGAMGVHGEVGVNPGFGGFYGLMSVGFDLNVAVGGGHRPPKG